MAPLFFIAVCAGPAGSGSTSTGLLGQAKPPSRAPLRVLARLGVRACACMLECGAGVSLPSSVAPAAPISVPLLDDPPTS